ncbi:MAG: DNA repair protein RecN (Recombination protein N) [Gammaproteobacteria bacterium]|jgi:DNA repair protein RecN (Recombination protein N)
MIESISIRNFAIIENLSLSLDSGLTVISGETGAGKSIVVDAMSIALGERADLDMIRHGCDRAEIAAEFNIASLPHVATWLQEQELDEEGSCDVRRVLRTSGNSAAWINGRKVALASLRELGEMLVDIHGQHEHQTLMRRPAQRDVIDNYGHNQPAAKQLAQVWQEWHQAKQQLDEIEAAARDRNERIDYLRFQQAEFDELDPQADETELLAQEHTQQANAESIIAACQLGSSVLYESDDTSAYSLLSTALREIEIHSASSTSLTETQELLNSALVQTQEAADQLRRHAEQIEIDPERLQWLDQRLGQLHDLARKHHVEASELTDVRERINDELSALENADVTRDELAAKVEHLSLQYHQQAADLSQKRHSSAAELSEKVSEVIRPLGMPEGVFVAGLSSDNTRFSADGYDQAEFLVSMNPGQPPKPLTKVASGGELSRVSLALQVIAADAIDTPCLVFDEVDTGIGGGVAEIVGRKLRELGVDRQVLCITHLPQVASHGHQHLFVHKNTDGKSTETAISKLTTEQRIEEVARMLGGVELTDQSRAHANEMLQHAAA